MDEAPSPPVVAVGLVARDRAGRLLLVERGNPPHKGRWSLPGGRVEGGETIAVAAGDAADARLVGLDQLPAYPLSPGLAGFLASIGCWPDGTPVPDDLPVPPPR